MSKILKISFKYLICEVTETGFQDIFHWKTDCTDVWTQKNCNNIHVIYFYNFILYLTDFRDLMFQFFNLKCNFSHTCRISVTQVGAYTAHVKKK